MKYLRWTVNMLIIGFCTVLGFVVSRADQRRAVQPKRKTNVWFGGDNL